MWRFVPALLLLLAPSICSDGTLDLLSVKSPPRPLSALRSEREDQTLRIGGERSLANQYWAAIGGPPEHPWESRLADRQVAVKDHGAHLPFGGNQLAGNNAPTENDSPAAANGDWLARVERDICAREYEASWNDNGLQAPNRAHNLRTYFEPQGIRVVDRTASGQPQLLALQMSAIGRAGNMKRMNCGLVSHDKARVEIRRAEVVEWYENSASGLEQGFTLETAPAGQGPVVVELSVDAAEVSESSDGAIFLSPSGRRIHYGGLAAFDANGASLPVNMDVGDEYVRLVMADEGAVYPVTIDPLLTATADSQLEVSQPNAQFGRYVSGAGDVNGDGFADVIVGAEFYDAGQTDEGAAFVFLGSAAGIASSSTPAATLQSNQTGASFGVVADAGDVNGDGYADVIVGAYRYNPGAAETDDGAAFVFLGSPTGIANGNPATAAAVLQSNQAGASMGISVAGAGDVNGDGYADVIVGAFDYNNLNEGAAFIFLGSPSGILSGGPANAATSLISTQGGSGFGYAVAGAGDVNGDGYADVVVGARDYDAGEMNEGAAFLFLGSGSGIASGNQTTAAATLQANQASGFMGISVDGAGDVNGDGYADVIVGASGYDAPETGEGAAFVFLGGVTGVANGSPATAAATIQSNQMSAGLGWPVAGAGDVNGDGYADVIVGAIQYDAGQTDEGAAFVFLGGPSGILSGSPTSSYATLQSNQATANMGIVAAAGDINGDGYADVIVGAYRYDAGQTDEGAAFVFLGGARGIVSGSRSMAAAMLEPTHTGASPLGGIAATDRTVASAGDVNGDGYADVIAGFQGYDGGETDEGAAFVFLGSDSGITNGTPASAAATLQSNQANAGLGVSVAGAGDVNGDGFADVIVGAFLYDAPESQEGAAFVFLGSATGIANGSPSSAAAMLQGNQELGIFGSSVAGAGDVNGDGYADVIVGASLYDAGQSNEGAAFVFLGSASGIASGGPADAAATLQSNQTGAFLGESVASAGDVNGDGYADVIVGASDYSAGEMSEGAAFVFLGSATGITNGSPVSAATTLQSNQAGARLGKSVAGAGDVNGDGYADVIVGAPGYNAGTTVEGAAFIFLGSATGIASGGAANAATRLESNQSNAQLGIVAGAGDVNGDGYADVIVGAPNFNFVGAAFVFLGSATGIANGNPATAAATLDQYHEGASAGDVNGDGYGDVIGGFYSFGTLVFLGGGGINGRAVQAVQMRGDGSGRLVQPWGGSYAPDRFQVRMNATDPAGRGRVKLEVEYCPPGKPFGSIDCGRVVSSSWTDVGTSPNGVALTDEILGSISTLYHWRARTLLAPFGVTHAGITPPPNPAHGPWRRLFGQAVEADIRTLAGPVAVEFNRDGVGFAIEHIPTPTRGTIALTIVLPSEQPAKLELLDIAGRRVLTREFALVRAGRHTVQLSDGRGLASGIYLLRLSQRDRTATARVVYLR